MPCGHRGHIVGYFNVLHRRPGMSSTHGEDPWVRCPPAVDITRDFGQADNGTRADRGPDAPQRNTHRSNAPATATQSPWRS